MTQTLATYIRASRRKFNLEQRDGWKPDQRQAWLLASREADDAFRNLAVHTIPDIWSDEADAILKQEN
jgi:hypothetical protein